ncbi:DUF4010 domain-containing protein [Rhodoplanes sp. Z2-YC6860]|uniref:DUF4010 domain-containing protein n=1 Tax=Rhodoplanes sp. Z2-YC6860 TaxID=674703 RepID=UPI000829E061|nr:DUF4010 domain-containing protein [Rhodoplanes sp. Z2-YC6860]
MVAGRLIADRLGGDWTIAGAVVVGLIDVDAITLSLARLAPQSLGSREAAVAILCAVATDTRSPWASPLYDECRNLFSRLAGGGRRFALGCAAFLAKLERFTI